MAYVAWFYIWFSHAIFLDLLFLHVPFVLHLASIYDYERDILSLHRNDSKWTSVIFLNRLGYPERVESARCFRRIPLVWPIRSCEKHYSLSSRIHAYNFHKCHTPHRCTRSPNLRYFIRMAFTDGPTQKTFTSVVTSIYAVNSWREARAEFVEWMLFRWHHGRT